MFDDNLKPLSIYELVLDIKNLKNLKKYGNFNRDEIWFESIKKYFNDKKREDEFIEHKNKEEYEGEKIKIIELYEKNIRKCEDLDRKRIWFESIKEHFNSKEKEDEFIEEEKYEEEKKKVRKLYEKELEANRSQISLEDRFNPDWYKKCISFFEKEFNKLILQKKELSPILIFNSADNKCIYNNPDNFKSELKELGYTEDEIKEYSKYIYIYMII